MNVDSILVSEYATQQSGLLTIVNVLNRVKAAKPPLVFPISVSLIIHGHAGEAGTQHEGEVQLLDGERQAVCPPTSFAWRFAPRGEMSPGIPVRHVHVVRFAGVQIESPGPYAFEVVIDGTYHAASAFYVEFTG